MLKLNKDGTVNRRLREEQHPKYRYVSPEEIAQRCAELQAGWTAREEAARRGVEYDRRHGTDDWRPPLVGVADLTLQE